MNWLKDNSIMLVYSALFVWIMADSQCEAGEMKEREVSALERIADALEAKQEVDQ